MGLRIEYEQPDAYDADWAKFRRHGRRLTRGIGFLLCGALIGILLSALESSGMAADWALAVFGLLGFALFAIGMATMLAAAIRAQFLRCPRCSRRFFWGHFIRWQVRDDYMWQCSKCKLSLYEPKEPKRYVLTSADTDKHPLSSTMQAAGPGEPRD